MAFLKALSDFGKNTGMLRHNIKTDIFNNITAAINIWIINPFFCGATKKELGNQDIKYITEAIVYKSLIKLFKRNFYVVRVIFNNYV